MAKRKVVLPYEVHQVLGKWLGGLQDDLAQVYLRVGINYANESGIFQCCIRVGDEINALRSTLDVEVCADHERQPDVRQCYFPSAEERVHVSDVLFPVLFAPPPPYPFGQQRGFAPDVHANMAGLFKVIRHIFVRISELLTGGSHDTANGLADRVAQWRRLFEGIFAREHPALESPYDDLDYCGDNDPLFSEPLIVGFNAWTAEVKAMMPR